MAKMILDADTGEAVDPQVGYVDGYGMEDRLLEGVLFEVTLDADGNPVCTGVHSSFQSYMDKFSKEQMAAWCKDVVEEGVGECMMDFAGKRDLLIDDPETYEPY